MDDQYTNRTNGAIGALLDEYERSILDLKKVISPISQAELMCIVDSETKDEDCRSIQTILTHVIRAGYAYVTYIRNWTGENNDFRPREQFESSGSYIEELDKMFAYNEKLFKDFPSIQIEENDSSKKILTSWGQKYDVEQLLEHAIVHILRHRRQIERFLLKLN